MPLDKSLERDPRHHSGRAQASGRSCKGNRRGGGLDLRNLPTVDYPERMESRIRPSVVDQIQYFSLPCSRIVAYDQSACNSTSPAISIRTDSERNRTIGSCAKVLYKQRMTSSTYVFPVSKPKPRVVWQSDASVGPRQLTASFFHISSPSPVK